MSGNSTRWPDLLILPDMPQQFWLSGLRREENDPTGFVNICAGYFRDMQVTLERWCRDYSGSQVSAIDLFSRLGLFGVLALIVGHPNNVCALGEFKLGTKLVWYYWTRPDSDAALGATTALIADYWDQLKDTLPLWQQAVRLDC